jgi:ATP-dependent protease ClpP protease subunit
MSKNGFYEFKNTESGPEFFIYDEIGGENGMRPQQFIKDFKSVSGNKTIRIHSPGGNIFDGMVMFSAISEEKANVTAKIDGIAASIAAVIPLAANKIIISENGFMMIHRAFANITGDADELRRNADALEKVEKQIISAISNRTKKSKSEVFSRMSDVSWFNSDEAVKFGLADEKQESIEVSNSFDLSMFNNLPDAVKNLQTSVTLDAKNLEKKLRDVVGLSRSAAKAFMAEGAKALGLRDVGDEDELRELLERKIQIMKN